MRKLFAERKFDLIHYSTPKAALIASLASWSLNHPRRLYTLRGLGYQSYSGIKRRIGFICEKIAVKLAHRIVAISHSLREEVVESKLGPASKFEVLGAGSSKGVDCERFCRSQDIMLRGASLRSSLGIQEGDCVIGYAGRLSPEKGIPETVEAFLVNYASVRSVHLILVGDLDRRCPLDTTVMDRCASQLNIHCLPHTEDMPGCMAAFDVFVLPSHREGFGNVLIEASAMGIPVISSDITGCRDAVLDGQTGILVYPGDPIALAAAMDTLVGNSDLRRRLGEQGAAWVRRDFDRRVVWNNLIEVYDEMLKS
jgi:glycosyltransferase involved in cell wall biosynthesis